MMYMKVKAEPVSDNLEIQLQRFKRDLRDAKRMNVPCDEEAMHSNILNTVIEPYKYKSFLEKNKDNPQRIESFKNAINDRIQNYFDKDRKNKLKKVYDEEMQLRALSKGIQKVYKE